MEAAAIASPDTSMAPGSATAAAAEVVPRMAALGLRLATAESTVGGLIGHLLTDVPGASRVFAGGITAYANGPKERLLGVPDAVLESDGSVSEPAVQAMAEGARRAFAVDVAIAESGIASTLDPPRAERPGGLYFVAIAAEGFARVERHALAGDRPATKQQAAAAALRLVLDYLDDLDDIDRREGQEAGTA